MTEDEVRRMVGAGDRYVTYPEVKQIVADGVVTGVKTLLEHMKPEVMVVPEEQISRRSYLTTMGVLIVFQVIQIGLLIANVLSRS